MKAENFNEVENCVVIVVSTKKSDDKLRKEDEITKLCTSTSLNVVKSFYQNLHEFNKATVLGSGKLLEIKDYISSCPEVIDVAVVDYNLTGSQIKNISDILGVRVIDRVGIIIDIFARRAKSSEAKLQVKLAQNRYLLPRLSAISGSSGRFGGAGVGMRGPGETKLELDKRKIEKEMDVLKKEIQKVKKQREVSKRERSKSGVKRIAIVGYTNAGKSTLLNVLSKENIYTEDKYFATLDTTSRKVYLGEGKIAILTDTVGFISDLPHELVDAFSSTLEEARDADLILHVVDKSEEKYYQKNIEITNKVLDDIGCKSERIVVFNKCDKLKELGEGIYISAKTGKGIEELKKIICEKLY